MADRVGFTTAIAKLIILGNAHGLDLILDWVLRDAATQQILFDRGRSKCDGTKRKSKHQFGTAADIYVIKHGVISDHTAHYEWLHDRWDELGGAKRLTWDMGHFEWK